MDNTNDFDKTMRPPADNADKTMRPPTGDADKTMRPDNSDKTLRPDGAQADKTLRPGQKNELNPLAIQDLTEFELNKVKFRVVETISKDSGEAIIYLVENNETRFVLKLYFSNLKPQPNHDIIEIVKQLAGTNMLVKTFDHGFWTNPQTSEKHDYELMEYCTGNSLDQLNINGNEKLLGEITLCCSAALNVLHKKQVIHRDVKPANFFFRKNDQNIENLALADFGISVQTDKDGKANIDYRYQLRTKIYTAPEVYTNIIDGKIQISYKSDFFSLGMMLLTLWNGEEIFKIDEYELNDMKFRGKLPYPKDLSERSLQLIMALTRPDPNTRAGFDEIARWAKGEDIYNIKSERDDIHQFRIPFNPAKNQTAKSPEELAKFMIEDPDLAIRYLYSGKISQWLTDNYQPVLGQDVDDIVEKKYPKDQKAGLYATCFRLDGEMPYYHVDSIPRHSPQEIAKSLRDNMKHYESALSYREHPLYLWMNARGMGNVTNNFVPLFKKNGNNRDVILQLIYTLDQSMPWVIFTEDDKTIECYIPEDVINAKYLHTFSVESLTDLCGAGFLTWLHNVEPAIEAKIHSVKDYKVRSAAVLYNLNPKVSYNFQLDEKADDYYFTATQIGYFMNLCMRDYIIDKKNIVAHNHIQQMRNIDDSALYDYFKSKGVYNDKIDWIRYCADLNSRDNTNKAGPYNWQIGVYKAIKGLGYNPFYYFPKSDKCVYNLDELSKIPAKDIRNEMKSGYLQAWLTTHYQEDPALDKTPKYAFEKETLKYLKHIERIDNNNEEVRKYHEAKNMVINAHAEPKKRIIRYLLNVIIAGSLTLIGIAVLFFLFFTTEIFINQSEIIAFHEIVFKGMNNISFGSWDDFWDFVGSCTVIFGVIGIVVGFFVLKQWGCLGKIIGGAAIGAIGGAIIGAILFVLYPLLGYIIAGLFTIPFFWLLIKTYKKNPIRQYQKQHKGVLKLGFEDLELDPLHFAFSNDKIFKSHFLSSINDISFIRKETKQFKKRLILPCIIIILLGSIIILSAYGSSKNFVEGEYNDGMTVVRKGTILNPKLGYADQDGNIIVPHIYSGALHFSEGLAGVKKNQWGFIDKNGNEVTPLKYDAVYSFREGLAGVLGITGLWGFIDKSGKEIIPFQYRSVRSFSEGLAVVGISKKWEVSDPERNNYYGIIDKKGNVIVPYRYSRIRNFNADGLAEVEKTYFSQNEYGNTVRNSLHGIINKNGKEIIPCDYYSVDLRGDLAIISKRVDTYQYRNSNGHISNRSTKYGVVDKNGNEIIPCNYANLTIKEEIFEAETIQNERLFFDKTGRRVNR